MKNINENYFINSHKTTINSIDEVLDKNEQLLWRGKPKKSAFILGAFFKMFPIALIWLIFDGGFIVSMFATGALNSAPAYVPIILVLFFAFHLTPVWIWLGNIITASIQHKNLEYAFTNKRIIIKSGVIGIDVQNIYYSEIESVNLKVGVIDRILHVGDIYIKSKNEAKVLFDIEDPYFITQKLQQIVIDIKTDVEFPNALRPETNPGYKTALVKKDEENK